MIPLNSSGPTSDGNEEAKLDMFRQYVVFKSSHSNTRCWSVKELHIDIQTLKESTASMSVGDRRPSPLRDEPYPKEKQSGALRGPDLVAMAGPIGMVKYNPVFQR